MNEPLKPTYLEYQSLVDRIVKGVTLVTGNLRLSHALRQSHDQCQLQRGLKVWETADILPWDAWLKRCFKDSQRHSVPPVQLLSDSQERLIWERVIAATDDGQSLLQIPAAAKHCAAGWRLMHEWQLTSAEIQAWQNTDSKVFSAWCEAFGAQCDSAGWITRSQLATLLTEYYAKHHDHADSCIIFSGFDEMTPQQAVLFDCLKESSCQVEWIEKKPLQADAVTIKLDQVRDEVETAARWARQILDTETDARVGIVVPELASQRTMVQGIFDRVLLADSIIPSVYDIQRPYNISLGLPLTRAPLVDTALLILDWQGTQCEVKVLSVLLNSPYLGGWQQERLARALLDRKIREYARQEISLTLLVARASDTSKPYYCPLLVAIIEKAGELISVQPDKASSRAWVSWFSTLLAAFGFLQGRSLSSEEFQTAEAWNDTLRELAQVDKVYRHIEASQARRFISQAAHERVFQPQTADTRIQILGLMEAIGMQFDYLWVMGLHDAVWPPTPRPNQFLPIGLQREKMLPHSSAKRELMMATHITQRLMGSAAKVVFSFPGSQGDEPLRLSSLLSDFVRITNDQLALWNEPLWDDVIFSSASSEIWCDTAVAIRDSEAVRGGSQIFKLQAICPFKAFAELRLGARPVDEVSLGLAASERGTLVHQVLEYFWHRVGDQKQLLDMDSKQKQKVVTDCVNRAISALESRRDETISARYKRLEQRRLETLLHEWLVIEEQRDPFTVLHAEQKKTFEVEGMTIHLKIDRIDGLADGGRIVIDYKTGQVNPSQWFGERPEEPQLPLYSMSFSEHLTGLVFAQLKPGESAFKGITQDKAILPGVKSCEQMSQAKKIGDWNALLTAWKTAIEKLAHDYKQGVAVVDPLRYPGSCQYCSLGQLCRVNERDNLIHDSEQEL